MKNTTLCDKKIADNDIDAHSTCLLETQIMAQSVRKQRTQHACRGSSFSS
jgi:hypothetical protein